MQNRCAPAVSVGDGHIDRVVDQRSVSGGGKRAGHDHSRKAVQDRAAIHLAVTGGMLGDIGAPQLVGPELR
jgi:hypothetical protein